MYIYIYVCMYIYICIYRYTYIHASDSPDRLKEINMA